MEIIICFQYGKANFIIEKLANIFTIESRLYHRNDRNISIENNVNDLNIVKVILLLTSV